MFQRLPATSSSTSTSRVAVPAKRGRTGHKLTVGRRDDPREREADRVAQSLPGGPGGSATVTGMPRLFPTDTHRSVPEPESATLLASPQPASSPATGAAPTSVYDVVNESGRALDPGTRAYFEPRFQRDFADVRIHDGPAADAASRSISARAFAVDGHIAFAAGQYSPHTPSGRALLAHELTHVVQQQHSEPHVVRGDWLDDLRQGAEEIASERLIELGNTPSTSPAVFTHPGCPPTFCQPFPSLNFARANLAWAGPLLLAGIASKVNSRVVPLWATYLAGGSAPQNLTADFGADFTASPTTEEKTRFLVGELRRYVETNHSVLTVGPTPTTFDFGTALAPALAALDDPAHPDRMDFDFVGDIAGNIAGGIGKDQLTHAFGARPSPFDDSRQAQVLATLTSDSAGNITVAPQIRFTVRDTIDLCPGNCGTGAEQVATIALSRFEATGLAGDIPMIIEFDGPAAELTPFVVPAPAPPPPATPVPGTVTASSLNVRAAPNTASAVQTRYPRHTAISVLCQTTGETVDGNDVWYQTSDGFVSARYVTLTSGATPATC